MPGLFSFVGSTESSTPSTYSTAERKAWLQNSTAEDLETSARSKDVFLTQCAAVIQAGFGFRDEQSKNRASTRKEAVHETTRDWGIYINGLELNGEIPAVEGVVEEPTERCRV